MAFKFKRRIHDTPGIVQAAYKIALSYAASFSSEKKRLASAANGKKGGIHSHKKPIDYSLYQPRNPYMRRPSKKIILVVPANFLKAMDELANKEARSRSELIREAIREYILKRPQLVSLASIQEAKYSD